ncbi:hypothetical protein ACQAYK_03965 [Acidithiobacillus sp. AC3]
MILFIPAGNCKKLHGGNTNIDTVSDGQKDCKTRYYCIKHIKNAFSMKISLQMRGMDKLLIRFGSVLKVDFPIFLNEMQENCI